MYYPRVAEPPDTDVRLTLAAVDFLRVFHGVPRHEPPSPAHDLTLGQIRLLFLLGREGPQPMGRIADVFELSSTAATGFVERIERHGFVERQHRSDDRRVVDCTLTESGTGFLQELSGVRLEAVRAALSELEPDELAEFHRLLRRVNERRGCPS
jgi:DNA-binding MarR family transcriptional regulator